MEYFAAVELLVAFFWVVTAIGRSAMVTRGRHAIAIRPNSPQDCGQKIAEK
jgi:hypothetical protein